MGKKTKLNEEDWGLQDYQLRREEIAQRKLEKKQRKNSRKRKRMEEDL